MQGQTSLLQAAHLLDTEILRFEKKDWPSPVWTAPLLHSACRMGRQGQNTNIVSVNPLFQSHIVSVLLSQVIMTL
jgi:hypothetical protein